MKFGFTPLLPVLLLAMPAFSQDATTARCAMPQEPPAAEVGAEPRIRVWSDKSLADWLPPACTGWAPQKSGAVVALSGSFRHEGDASVLLRRLGAVSSLRGLRYWSVSDRDWRVLVTDAAALETGNPERRRADFSPAEIRTGSEMHFTQADSRSSAEVRYRLRVLASGGDRIAVTTENTSPVKLMLFTLFDPGELRAAYFLEHRGGGIWNLYALSTAAGSSAAGNEASLINRAAAFYRHFSGMAGDARPPMAR